MFSKEKLSTTLYSFLIRVSFCIAFLSCKSKWEKQKKTASHSAIDFIKNECSKDSIKVDSINILLIDTLNPQKDSLFTFIVLQYVQQSLFEETKIHQDKMKDYLQYMRAFSGYGDLSFWETGFNEAKVKSEALFRISNAVYNRGEMLLKLDSLGKIDSLTKTGFRVLLNFRGSKDLKEVRSDSVVLLLNNDHKIIERREQVLTPYIDAIEKVK